MKISDSLLQDLIATRREIEALSRMQLTIHLTGGAASSGVRPITVLENGKYSKMHSSNVDLHSIARGDTFQSPVPVRSFMSVPNQDYSRPVIAPRAYHGSNIGLTQEAYTEPILFRTPQPRVCPPPPLMSYYGHLLPPRQTPVQPTPSPRDDRRRAYLARLEMGR